MRSFVSFIFVSLTAVLLSSCGGGGGGGDGGGGVRPATVTPRPPSPPVSPNPMSVDVSFEADVQGAPLEDATDTINQRAKRADGRTLVETHIDVVVTDDDVTSSGGLVGFVLPPGGCKVIEKGVYANYLVSYRQGIEGELECLPSCSGVSRAVVTQGYRILLCVAEVEVNAESLVFKAGECKGGKVVKFDTRGCQAESDCTTSGYKVDSGACVASSRRDCTGEEQGFDSSAGKCVATPRDARHCQAVGKVLKFHRKGCETALACTTEERKVVGNLCVGKVAADCTGEDGLHNGKCVPLPSVASYCVAAGKVLQIDGEGCQSAAACEASGFHKALFTNGLCLRICDGQTRSACVGGQTAQQRCQSTSGSVWNSETASCQTSDECEMSGYKVSEKTCVRHDVSECAGTQGFEAGKCIPPTTATHCTSRGPYVLDVLGKICQTEDACRSERNEVIEGACVSEDSHTSCTGEQGFDRHECIALPTDSDHCQVIDKVLQLDGEGCQQAKACTDAGYRVFESACIRASQVNCTGTVVLDDGRCIDAVDYCTGAEEGFANGMCVAQPQDAGHCQAVGKVLQFDTEGCQLASACTEAGYKVQSNACVVKVLGDCSGEQGLHGGKCVAMPQDAGHCQAAGKVLQRDRRGCESAMACTTAGYKVESNACVVKVAGDCTGTARMFDTGGGRCVTTPLSSPDAVDASFDEAFLVKREDPVRFCTIGSGSTTNDMSHIGSTIVGRNVCRHQDMVTSEQVYRAFVDTDYSGSGKKIPTNSIVAFTHAVDVRLPGELSSDVQVAAPAFADGGLNRSVLEGYKVFIPTGDNGHADFLADSDYASAERFRIGDALHFGDAFAVGRLNAAGDGRHAQSNGCGGRSNCVLAHGAFTVNGSAFEGTPAATAYVAASIARALSHASIETTIGAVNELFDAAKVDIDGVPVFHPFRLIDKARELADRHQAALPGFPLADKFDEVFPGAVTRTTDVCFLDTSSMDHYWSVNAVLQTILSTQYEVTCGHDYVDLGLSPDDTDYFGDNALPIHKMPVGAIVNLSIEPSNVFGRGLVLSPPYSKIEGYKFFISAGNGREDDRPYSLFGRDRKTVDVLSEFVYLSDDVFFIALLAENKPSHYHFVSSHCGILPNCAAARSGYNVRLGNRSGWFSGTSGSAPHVTASIARAMLNSPPDTPLDHVNDFFYGALDWNSQIKLFNPIKLIDLVREL